MMAGSLYHDIQAAQAVGTIPIIVGSDHPIPLEIEERLRHRQVQAVSQLGTVAEVIVDGFQTFLAGEKRSDK